MKHVYPSYWIVTYPNWSLQALAKASSILIDVGAKLIGGPFIDPKNKQPCQVFDLTDVYCPFDSSLDEAMHDRVLRYLICAYLGSVNENGTHNLEELGQPLNKLINLYKEIHEAFGIAMKDLTIPQTIIQIEADRRYVTANALFDYLKSATRKDKLVEYRSLVGRQLEEVLKGSLDYFV
jgi:hypothetical protein